MTPDIYQELPQTVILPLLSEGFSIAMMILIHAHNTGMPVQHRSRQTIPTATCPE